MIYQVLHFLFLFLREYAVVVFSYIFSAVPVLPLKPNVSSIWSSQMPLSSQAPSHQHVSSIVLVVLNEAEKRTSFRELGRWWRRRGDKSPAIEQIHCKRGGTENRNKSRARLRQQVYRKVKGYKVILSLGRWNTHCDKCSISNVKNSEKVHPKHDSPLQGIPHGAP